MKLSIKKTKSLQKEIFGMGKKPQQQAAQPQAQSQGEQTINAIKNALDGIKNTMAAKRDASQLIDHVIGALQDLKKESQALKPVADTSDTPGSEQDYYNRS